MKAKSWKAIFLLKELSEKINILKINKNQHWKKKFIYKKRKIIRLNY